jgi:hypothetical protein
MTVGEEWGGGLRVVRVAQWAGGGHRVDHDSGGPRGPEGGGVRRVLRLLPGLRLLQVVLVFPESSSS